MEFTEQVPCWLEGYCADKNFQTVVNNVERSSGFLEYTNSLAKFAVGAEDQSEIRCMNRKVVAQARGLSATARLFPLPI